MHIESILTKSYTAGAFTRCLKMLYEQRTGRTLEVTRYGKPHNVTYEYDSRSDYSTTSTVALTCVSSTKQLRGEEAEHDQW